MCVICPVSLILLYLVQSKHSNYDIPYQAIISSFLSFSAFKAEVYVDIHTHTVFFLHCKKKSFTPM